MDIQSSHGERSKLWERWELHGFLRSIHFATNICQWIWNRAMTFSGFWNIFIIKPKKEHGTLLPPSCQKDHRRFILRSDEWFRRSEVHYDESLLVWILYLSSRLIQFVMVSFSLKKKKMSYLVHKAAKQNSLQTVNNTFKIQKQKLKTLSSLAQRWYAMAISSKITGNVRIRTI